MRTSRDNYLDKPLVHHHAHWTACRLRDKKVDALCFRGIFPTKKVKKSTFSRQGVLVSKIPVIIFFYSI